MLKYDKINMWLWISHVNHILSKIARQDSKRANLPQRQSAVLMIIYELGNEATPSTIAERFFREHNTVSEIINRMEKAGLVKRVKDMKQKTQVRIQLTEKGIEAKNQIVKYERMDQIMSCLTMEERRSLRSCLKKIRDNAVKELGIKDNMKYPP